MQVVTGRTSQKLSPHSCDISINHLGFHNSISAFFGSDRSSRSPNLGSPCDRVCTLCNRALRMALKDFLQHSKESRGGLEASRQPSKHLEGIQSEPYPVGACYIHHLATEDIKGISGNTLFDSYL